MNGQKIKHGFDYAKVVFVLFAFVVEQYLQIVRNELFDRRKV